MAASVVRTCTSDVVEHMKLVVGGVGPMKQPRANMMCRMGCNSLSVHAMKNLHGCVGCVLVFLRLEVSTCLIVFNIFMASNQPATYDSRDETLLYGGRFSSCITAILLLLHAH